MEGTSETVNLETGEIMVSPIRRSQSIAKLVEALAKASLEFAEIPKDTQNPFYKSTYADLSALIKATRPALGKHGLILSQFPFTQQGRAGITTLLACVDEWMECDLSLPVAKSDAQGIGSGLTYARRYSYQGILNIAGEADDDGNAASGKKVSQAEDAFYERTGTEGASPAIVKAFETMFAKSGKTSAQLATILQARYKAASPSELTTNEVGELVKWAASKEPIEQTLQTSVDATQRTLLPDPETPPKSSWERIAVMVKDLVLKQMRAPKKGEYLILECFGNQQNYDVFSWDQKINAQLQAHAKGQPCIFAISRTDKGVSLKEIVEIAGVPYADNAPADGL